MKKLQAKPTSGLTGSRKKKRKPHGNRAGQVRVIRVQDRAIDCIRHVEVLAGLLEAAGQNQLVPVEAELVNETAVMIQDETDRLRDALDDLARLAGEK